MARKFGQKLERITLKEISDIADPSSITYLGKGQVSGRGVSPDGWWFRGYILTPKGKIKTGRLGMNPYCHFVRSWGINNCLDCADDFLESNRLYLALVRVCKPERWNGIIPFVIKGELYKEK
jgi:hypothetical protein